MSDVVNKRFSVRIIAYPSATGEEIYGRLLPPSDGGLKSLQVSVDSWEEKLGFEAGESQGQTGTHLQEAHEDILGPVCITRHL